MKKSLFFMLFALSFIITSTATYGEQELSLSDCIQLALAHNLSLHVTREEVNRASGALLLRKNLQYPLLSLQLATGSRDNVKEYRTRIGTQLEQALETSLGLDVPGTLAVPYLDDSYGLVNFRMRFQLTSFGRQQSSIKSGRHELNASNFLYKQKRLEIILRVKEIFYRLSAYRELQDIHERYFNRAEEILVQCRKKTNSGEWNIPEKELLLAEVELEGLKDLGLQVSAVYRDSLDQLKNELGIKVTRELVLKKEKLQLTRLWLEEDKLIEQGLKFSPEYQAVSELLKKLQADLEYSKKLNNPVLYLEGEYSHLFDSLESTPERLWAIALKMDFTIFDGWKKTAEVIRARAALNQAIATHQAVKNKIALELREGIRRIKMKEKRLAILKKQADNLTGVRKILADQFESKKKKLVELLKSYREEYSAWLSYYQEVCDYQFEKAKLLKNLGQEEI